MMSSAFDKCPKCGAYLRLFGDIRYEMMMCMDRGHDLCYWPDDYDKDGNYTSLFMNITKKKEEYG